MKDLRLTRYGEEAENYIRDLTATPKSTHAIAKAAKFKYPHMQYLTVRRILEKLYKAGKVTKTDVGKMAIWALNP